MADIAKVKAVSGDGISSITAEGDTMSVTTIYGDEPVKVATKEVLAERCVNCKSKKHVAYDELLGDSGDVIESRRFDEVERLEAMTPDERYEFWRGELSRCIRCNACRNVCPACTCEQCIFDNPNSGVSQKAAVTSFEENLFHIIRAFHVAGRCTDCGECSRVCPQHIPLHLLNRKFIKDINEFYGDYQAGADPEAMICMLEGLGVSAIGMNCSLGPDKMAELLPRFIKSASVPVIVNPNAGLPSVIDGRTVFDCKAED